MPTPILNPESRRQLHEADQKWLIYTIFRSVVVVFSLIGFSVFASAIPIWDKYFYWGNGPNRGDWQDGFPIGVLVFAFLWNNVALYLLVIRKKSIQPWIPLIIDFLAWGALIPAVTWSTGLGMFLNWTDRIEEFINPQLWDILVDIGRRELVGVCFACFVWLLEVIIFILACIDTHKWRKARKGSKPSLRHLEHHEYSQDDDRQQFGTSTTISRGSTAAPPKYEEATGHSNRHSHQDSGIEMSPSSANSREFV